MLQFRNCVTVTLRHYLYISNILEFLKELEFHREKQGKTSKAKHSKLTKTSVQDKLVSII